MSENNFPFNLRPLSQEEGGGWLISYPDLPGCISDGETPEEAIKNGLDAKKCWIQACKEAGRVIPDPHGAASGKFVTRLPKSLHSRLVARAKQEGISMNSLVTTFIAECLGKIDSLKKI